LISGRVPFVGETLIVPSSSDRYLCSVFERSVTVLPTAVGASEPAPSSVPPSTSRALVRLARPKQLAKNLLVFAAPAAAGILSSPSVATRAGLAFISFSAVAGATYVLNDVLDLASDRSHPVKQRRPLAAGHLSVKTAMVFAAVSFVIGASVAVLLGAAFVGVVGAYVALTVAYSVALKRVEVFDMAVIAAGFVLRAVGGGAATGVTLSSWFVILISAGALFVVAGKRLADLRYAQAAGLTAFEGRPVYPEPFLRSVAMVAAGVAVMAYCLWSLAVPHDVDGVAWSQVSVAPFVVALLRFGLIIERGQASAPEEVFLTDRVLQGTVVVWVAIYIVAVYL
jgi:decaprenyl-phosphate phosphoribosyltransferase